eukprot:9348571-Lingulodinium_polyedra.AAC.1
MVTALLRYNGSTAEPKRTMILCRNILVLHEHCDHIALILPWRCTRIAPLLHEYCNRIALVLQ